MPEHTTTPATVRADVAQVGDLIDRVDTCHGRPAEGCYRLSPGDVYACTLLKDHGPFHVAQGPDEVATAVWTDPDAYAEPEPEPEPEPEHRHTVACDVTTVTTERGPWRTTSVEYACTDPGDVAEPAPAEPEQRPGRIVRRAYTPTPDAPAWPTSTDPAAVDAHSNQMAAWRAHLAWRDSERFADDRRDEAEASTCHGAPVDPAEDLAYRLRPSHAQRALAAALLAPIYADTDADAWTVLVPLTMPGKTGGMWTVGQPVHAAPGAWLAYEDPTGAEVPDPFNYRANRRRCIDVAWSTLEADGRPGTVAYAVINHDGSWEVHEEAHDVHAWQ